MTPTGRHKNHPEIQDLRWGRKTTSVAEHTLSTMDFRSLELKTMSHSVLDYHERAKAVGISHVRAEEILQEEVERTKSSLTLTVVDALNTANRRLSE